MFSVKITDLLLEATRVKCTLKSISLKAFQMIVNENMF